MIYSFVIYKMSSGKFRHTVKTYKSLYAYLCKQQPTRPVSVLFNIRSVSVSEVHIYSTTAAHSTANVSCYAKVFLREKKHDKYKWIWREEVKGKMKWKGEL